MPKHKGKQKILVYGAGAVGLGLASFLVNSGSSVTLLGRPESVEKLRREGIKRKGIFGNFTARKDRFSCYAKLKEIPKGFFDFILVCTKSFDSLTAARNLKDHSKLWGRQTKIVLCQNGWGNAEIFAEYFPKKQIFNARIITGFERYRPNTVKVTVHADAIHLGSLFTKNVSGLEALAQALTQGGIPAETTLSIEKDLWAKMLYNCALNPLGAIFDVPYGALGKNEFSRQLMSEIFKEIFGVMRAAGYQTHWPGALQYEKAFYQKFLPPTARHRSSTLQDLRCGKKTEIDALNGMIVTLGEKLKTDVKTNRSVYLMVKFLESKNPS